jgi:hypothetical protein
MKYKVIKSAAHNFGHSFVSLMNYRGDDYVMSHLARLVVETGQTELSVDLLSGRGAPSTLLWGPIRASVAAYMKWLPTLLGSHQIDPSILRSATMKLIFRPKDRYPIAGFAGAWGIPFECVVTLGDDRGEVHEGRVRDVWMVDTTAPPHWLRSVYWWRAEVRRWWFFSSPWRWRTRSPG